MPKSRRTALRTAAVIQFPRTPHGTQPVRQTAPPEAVDDLADQLDWLRCHNPGAFWILQHVIDRMFAKTLTTAAKGGA